MPIFQLITTWAIIATFLLRAAEASPVTMPAISDSTLPAQTKKQALKTVKSKTFTYASEEMQFEGNLTVLNFLLDNLDICVEAGRYLDTAEYWAKKEDDGRIFGEDRRGARGYLSVIDQSDEKRLLFMQGKQKSIVTVKGSSVMQFQLQPIVGQSDTYSYSMNAWIRIGNPLMAFFSRIFVGKARRETRRHLNNLLGIPIQVTEKLHLNTAETITLLKQHNQSQQFSSLIALAEQTYSKQLRK